MAKETCLFNQQFIKSILLAKNKPLKVKLDEVALLFEQKWQIKIYFCRIFERRWSFFAGYKGTVIPEKKIILNGQLGMIIENDSLTDCQWQDFKNQIIKYLVFDGDWQNLIAGEKLDNQ